MAIRPDRLTTAQVRQHLRIWDLSVRRAAMELRRVILREAPAAGEKIAFGVLCYYEPECIWGVIGGNVCMIQPDEDYVSLGFIHGAVLEDPRNLLKGTGKHKRHLVIRSLEEARLPAVAALIRAAAAEARKASLR
jgi:hypothetical protein